MVTIMTISYSFLHQISHLSYNIFFFIKYYNLNKLIKTKNNYLRHKSCYFHLGTQATIQTFVL